MTNVIIFSYKYQNVVSKLKVILTCKSSISLNTIPNIFQWFLKSLCLCLCSGIFALVDNSEPDSEADDSSETSESSECPASDDAGNEENQESGSEGVTVEDLLANLKTKSPKVQITIPQTKNNRIATAQENGN